MTWRPWKPVATKNTDPYTESAMQKEASMYSITWREVNNTPKTKVKKRPWMASSLLPEMIAWCAQVTVAPELRRTAVFKRGTEKGFRTSIPWGGHMDPNSMAGTRLLWKKAQKKEKKKQISERMKRIIPIFKPRLTIKVWWPWKVASLITSRHQTKKINTKTATPNRSNQGWL